MIARLELVAGVNHLPNGVIVKGVLPLSTVLLRGHSFPNAKKCAITRAGRLHAVRGRAFIGGLEAHRLAHLRRGDHEVDRGDRRGLHVLEDVGEKHNIHTQCHVRCIHFTLLSVYCSAEVVLEIVAVRSNDGHIHLIMMVHVKRLACRHRFPRVCAAASMHGFVYLKPIHRSQRHRAFKHCFKRRIHIRRLAERRRFYRGGDGGDRSAICQRGRRNEAYYHDQAYENTQ